MSKCQCLSIFEVGIMCDAGFHPPTMAQRNQLQGTTSIPKGCSSMSMSCRANFSCGRQIRWVFPSCGDGHGRSGANPLWILGVFNNNGFLPDAVLRSFSTSTCQDWRLQKNTEHAAVLASVVHLPIRQLPQRCGKVEPKPAVSSLYLSGW